MEKKRYAKPLIRVLNYYVYMKNNFLVSGEGTGDDWQDHNED